MTTDMTIKMIYKFNNKVMLTEQYNLGGRLATKLTEAFVFPIGRLQDAT